MSFGFGGSQAQGAGGSANTANTAGDLAEVTTEQLGFQAIAGDLNLRLLPSPWPTENPPPAAASLLSIASGKSLVAAAGPDSLVLAETHTVRQTLRGGGSQFEPAVTLQTPRLSHVAFSSDESCLVVAAEQGGGLAVYDTNALTNGGKDSAFQISTNGANVRQLLPNPNPSDATAHQFAIVLDGGQLLLADLKARALSKNAGGNPIFHENVTSACWSRLGKQIVAGRQDGTAVQIDPQGNVKAEIPIPPQLREVTDSRAQSQPLMSIYWIETNDFLLVHTPINPARPPTPEMGDYGSDFPPEPPTDASVFHLAQRPNPKSNEWTFRKVVDPTPAFITRGRTPAHHFIQRLKDWPPSLDDVLLTISSISSDVGMLTKSKTPLDSANPATDVFTTTINDARRAGMPMSVEDGMSDTSAIGMALDLSVKEFIERPIPTDETLDESPVPLPALYVLNNEGMLNVWYIVYNESIQQKIPMPDLIAAGGPRPLEAKKEGVSPRPGTAANTSGPALSSFGASVAPPKPAAPQPSASTFGGFGSPNTPAFGGSSALGSRSSPWGTPGAAATGAGTPSFGKTAFGQPGAASTGASFGAFGKPAFGAPSTSGPKSSAFGQPAFGAPSAPTAGGSGFGQVGGMGGNKTSVWGSAPASQPSASSGSGPSFGQQSVPFGGNANLASPFTSFTGNSDTQESKSIPWLSGGGQSTPSFGGAATQQKDNKSIFSTQPSFGSTATLGSATSGSLFGGAGSSTFGKPSLPSSREETMGSNDDVTPTKPEESKSQQSGSGLSGLGGGGFKLGSTFKSDGTAKDDLPKPTNAGSSFFGGGFGSALGEVGKKPEQPATPIKREPGTEEEPRLQDIPAVSTTPASPPKRAPPQPAAPAGLEEVLKQKPKRFFGDLPPMDGGPVQAAPKEEPSQPAAPPSGLDEVLKQKPKRFFGDLPPSDGGPGGAPKEQDSKPNRPLFGEVPSTGDVPKLAGSPRKAPEKPLAGLFGAMPKHEESEVPVAGSPPVDLGAERFSQVEGSEEELPPGPDDDGSDEWDDEDVEEEDGDGEDGDGEDGDGEDDDEEDGDENGEDHTPDKTGSKTLGAFEARLTPASPRPPEQRQGESTTPATEPKKASYTPAGFPKPAVAFPPPSKSQESPRSPSPVRGSTTPMSKPPTFGQSSTVTFGQPSTGSFGQPSTGAFGQPARPASSTQQPQRIAVPAAEPAPRPVAPAPRAEPTEGDLQDEEDERVKAVLKSKPEPRKDVPHFLAHQNYVGSTDKPGVGGQIEKVYRDINSMLDTLGLNAHALQGFVDGQSALKAQEDRSRDHLEDEEPWTVDEIPQLQEIQKDIDERLEEGALEDVKEMVEDLHEEDKETARARAKLIEVRKQIRSHADPEQKAALASAALSTETQTQQAELRQGVQKVQTLLGQVEEAMSLLRVNLSSAARASNQPNSAAAKMPTVEAVTNTILKMTAMIEQKSGDIDVLEAQIKRLPHGLASLNLNADYEDELVAGLTGNKLLKGVSSPHSTPRSSRSRMLANGDAPGMSGMLGSRFRTPPSGVSLGGGGRRSVMFSPEASRLGMSTSSVTGSARKKVTDVTIEEVEGYLKKAEKRRRVFDALREGVAAKGPRVVKAES